MIVSSSLVRTTGFPISESIAQGDTYKVGVLNGPAYLTLETIRNPDGYYTGSASFLSVSSSKAASQVFGDYDASAYIGRTNFGSLTFTAANDIPSNNILIKVATPENISIDSSGSLNDSLANLQQVTGFFENNQGTQNILITLQDCN